MVQYSYMDRPQNPDSFRPLGKRLKELRNRANESLAEASGAVEIDVKDLAGFELGRQRPSEEVLLLLISHFGAHDDEAVTLWELAGYDMDKVPAAHQSNAETSASVDSPILFTDVVDVVVNNYGVVMNFMQAERSAGKQRSVARVGMSREHAKSVLHILQTTLSRTDKNVRKQPRN